MDEIKIIGITGSIGSGKSTVSEIMKQFGGNIINADEIAKELMKRSKPAYHLVVEYFGKDILAPDGEIDRKALGNIVFNDKEKLNKLNALTHKAVGNEIKMKILELKEELSKLPLKKGDFKFVILEVPIPVEEGFFDTADTIWTTTANNDTRIERIIKRNGMTENEAESIISSQMTNSEYEAIADTVIINEGDEEQLKKIVAKELINYFNIEIEM